MSKEQNIKVYNRAYEYLLSIKPEGVELDNYFYGDSKNFKSLKDIYIQFITSAQNYQRMPKVIKYSQRKSDVSEMLFNYDIQQIAEILPEKLYREFRDRFNVTSNDSSSNSWYKWSRSIVDSAKFLRSFKDASDFDEFVIGFALACDLLKELGYTYYPKPDVHMIDVFHGIGLCEKDPISVFETIERIATDCRTVDDSVTPYKVDKVFWLICSGNFYKENLSIKRHKAALIELLKNEMTK